MKYSDKELKILSRQFILKIFSEDKINILNKVKISIIGLGGIGCPLATYLISSGVKNIKLIDGDSVELSNLNRQILFTNDDIGEKKVKIAKNRLLKINPYCNINTVDIKLTKINLNYLLNSNIVIDATDNWENMKIVNEFCVKNYIPLITSSVVGYDIEVALFENNKKNHLCLNCLFPNKKDVDLPRCDTVGIAGIAAGMAGLITAQKTINFLLKFKKESNMLLLLNALDGSSQNIALKKNYNCYLN
tara:strand:+ start:35 stop:775 length:741 start_codon:yes stop_codon:yes gene_type:complete